MYSKVVLGLRAAVVQAAVLVGVHVVLLFTYYSLLVALCCVLAVVYVYMWMYTCVSHMYTYV